MPLPHCLCGFKQSWAHYIRQVYEVDPLPCPQCAGPMRIIACIDPPEVIEQILSHLGLCPGASLSAPEAAAALAEVRGHHPTWVSSRQRRRGASTPSPVGIPPPPSHPSLRQWFRRYYPSWIPTDLSHDTACKEARAKHLINEER